MSTDPSSQRRRSRTILFVVVAALGVAAVGGGIAAAVLSTGGGKEGASSATNARATAATNVEMTVQASIQQRQAAIQSRYPAQAQIVQPLADVIDAKTLAVLEADPDDIAAEQVAANEYAVAEHFSIAQSQQQLVAIRVPPRNDVPYLFAGTIGNVVCTQDQPTHWTCAVHDTKGVQTLTIGAIASAKQVIPDSKPK